MNYCPDCNKGFSRRDNMLRHQRHMHDGVNEIHLSPQEDVSPLPPKLQEGMSYPQPGMPPPPPPQEGMSSPQAGMHPPPPPPQEGMSSPQAGMSPPPHGAPHRQDMTALYHPFTMMISGPTACGKTTFVRNLLQNHSARIQPCIQRIVWLYKRWQPLYDIIQRTIIPKLEFIQGIPTDLDDDDYFDSKVNNLLIIDDLFSESGKDKSITDLFTEGSHHRSISIISINQNLFGTKDCTQKRNCQYLVLFNSPVDRQSIMTLSRQMYPGHTNRFMKSFEKATKHPYGYLFVDLKPFTKENDRLKYDIQWTDGASANPESSNHVQASLQKTIKEITPNHTGHYSVGVQTDHINEILQTSNRMAEKAHSCYDCGLLFDSSHDVQRHVQRGWCPENSCEPPTKKAKMEATDGDNIEENEGYLHLWSVAQKQSMDRFNKMYEEYIGDGEDDDDATEMAEERTQPFKEKTLFDKYQALLELYWIPLMINATHHSIVEQIDNLRNKGISLPTAVKRVLKKNKKNFEELFETENSEEESDESDDEESGDESE